MYALKKNNSTVWENSIIEDNAGSNSSLTYLDVAVDSKNMVSVVYIDKEMGYLKYVKFPESGVVNSNDIIKEIIDDYLLDISYPLSMDIDKNDSVHVAYEGIYGLRYAVRVRDQWHIFEIKDISEGSGLVVDNAGRINIAYGNWSYLQFIRPGKLIPVTYELEK